MRSAGRRTDFLTANRTNHVKENRRTGSRPKSDAGERERKETQKIQSPAGFFNNDPTSCNIRNSPGVTTRTDWYCF
ncbi:MAG: hypothetical protein DME26_14250 [Verrucomicrobia bacterium]|nr:MAG: hypothetical protein DME26_14250 [Verrucomicrobiota bacterium]